MNLVALADVEAFAKKWLHAGSHLVQHWPAWEAQAAEFFDVAHEHNDSDELHGVMKIVCAVCFGNEADVKAFTRDATPKVVALATSLLGHLHQFAVVLEAEGRFRAGELKQDWTVRQSDDGELTVRSVFKRTTVGETEH